MADSKNDRPDRPGPLRADDPAGERDSTPKPATGAEPKVGGAPGTARSTTGASPPPAKLATRQQSGATAMINGRPTAPSAGKRVALKVVGPGPGAKSGSPPRRAKQTMPPSNGPTKSSDATRGQATLKATINRTSMNPDAHSRSAAGGTGLQAPHGGPAKPDDVAKIEVRDAPAATAASGQPPKTAQSAAPEKSLGKTATRSEEAKKPGPDKSGPDKPESDKTGSDKAESVMPGTVMPGRPIVSRKSRPAVAPPERPAPKVPGEPGTLPPQLLRPGKEKSSIVNPFTKKRRAFGKSTGRPILVTAVVALIGVLVWQSGLFDERVDALFDGPTPPKRAATEPAALETAAPSESDVGAAEEAESSPRTASTAILQTTPATDPDRPLLQEQELEEVIELLGTLDLLPEGSASGDEVDLAGAIVQFQEMAGLEASGQADRALLEELRTVTGMMRDEP